MKLSRRNLLSIIPAAAAAQQSYSFGPDSQVKPGVPRGTVTRKQFTSPKVYPATVRDYWVYVPAQYNPAKPACGMVFQDGGGYIADDGQLRGPLVMDNLIAAGQMPVTIGIFINPGVAPALSDGQQARYNRSFEYDAIGPRYASFLIDELIPEVEKEYSLSKDPNDWALCGQSSGGIAAFNAAWFRPDKFRRVVSFIGSFVNLRGGHNLSPLVRKSEPKPLRVFLQDGTNDNNIYAGSWWMGNQDLHASLDFVGYDTTFVTGTEAHNMKHGGAILPDALRWVWREYPKPIAKPSGKGDRYFIHQIITKGSEWQEVSAGHRFTEGPAVAPNGDVFFTDVPSDKIHRIDHATGKSTVFRENAPGCNGMMFGPDGRLYVCLNKAKKIVSYGMDGSEKVLAEGVTSNDLTVTAAGNVYFTDPPSKKIWLIDAKGSLRAVHEGFEFPNGVVTSPDNALLMVADMRTKWVWSFRIQPDGALADGQAFYRMETPDDSSSAQSDGMTTDSEGYLYVATRLGVQVCDQPGRVVAILDKPHAGSLSNVVFGGPQLDTLYVTAGDRVFRRPMQRRGVWPWKTQKPPVPRL